MSIPDLTAFTIGDARQILLDAGMKINSVTVTAPPKEKHTEYDDSYRIIRFRVIDTNNVDLLVVKPL